MQETFLCTMSKFTAEETYLQLILLNAGYKVFGYLIRVREVFAGSHINNSVRLLLSTLVLGI
jgi:hypothetical protein